MQYPTVESIARVGTCGGKSWYPLDLVPYLVTSVLVKVRYLYLGKGTETIAALCSRANTYFGPLEYKSPIADRGAGQPEEGRSKKCRRTDS